MQHLLSTFDFNEQAVRVLIIDDAPHFVAADVCRVLEIVDTTSALRSLDEDEKITQHNERGNPRAGIPHQFTVITESGLYALVFASRKPEAKAFRKWVTSEVLPSLRKTGRYEVAGALAPDEEATVQELIATIHTAIKQKVAGKLSNGEAAILVQLASQMLRGYDVVLRLRAGKGAA